MKRLCGVFHRLKLDVKAITEMTTMALASREERPSFLGSFSIHAPFFQSRHRHGRVEGFQTGFFFHAGHLSLCEYVPGTKQKRGTSS